MPGAWLVMYDRSILLLLSLCCPLAFSAACGDDDDPPATSATTTGTGGQGGEGAAGGVGGMVEPTYGVSVDVSGLWGKLSLTLAPSGETIEVAADGTQTFTQALDDGTSYTLSAVDPPLQTCAIEVSSGIVDGADVHLAVTCASHLVFVGQQSDGDYELYASDGTEAGTRRIADIHPSGSSFPNNITPTSTGQVFFTADDGSAGRELWVTDGTTDNTRMVVELGPGTDDAAIDDMVGFGAKLFFSAAPTSTSNDVELWSSDGTPSGTSRRFDLRPGSDGSYPYAFVVSGSRLYFQAGVDNIDDHLFMLEGGALTDLGLAFDGDGFAGPNGSLFDSKYDGSVGRELARSEGTAATTGLVTDINPNGGSDPQELIFVGDDLLFAATDGTSGTELYVYRDGTASRVADIHVGSANSYPAMLGVVDGRVIFSADDGVHGRELWVTDGTTSGTSLLADVTPGSGGSGLRLLGKVEGAILVAAFPSADPSQSRLLRVDPTGITVLFESPTSTTIDTAVGEALGQPCFGVSTPATGYELWCSDGTAAGTRKVIELCAGSCNGLAVPS